jgi:hypothetical protein
MYLPKAADCSDGLLPWVCANSVRFKSARVYDLGVGPPPPDGIERQVFPAYDNRCQQSRPSCGQNQSQDGYFTLYRICWFNFCAVLLESLHCEFYRWSSILLCGGKFHFCCGIAVSSICVT